jgi:flagellar assembly factor FliW
MPWLHTTHFGRLDYTAASVLEFPEGLPGFESERQFVLVERPQYHPLVFLQSVRNPELSLPALPVRVVERNYELRLHASDIELLGLSAQPRIGEDIVVLSLIAVHEQCPTANLLAPVVVNLRTNAAAQCIDPDLRYSHRHPLVIAMEAAS